MMPTDPARREETPAERLDRNWNELLQEFRVAQTGIQILFGFLLILPFQSRFTEVDGFQRLNYLIIFAFITIATLCILAPVMAHRLLFRRKLKGRLVDLGSVLAKLALGFLGAALLGAVGLVVSVVSTHTVAWIAVGITVVVLLVLWFVVPLVLGSGSDED